jgi:hypothetical protein
MKAPQVLGAGIGYRLPPYERIGCGELQRSECTQITFPSEADGNWLITLPQLAVRFSFDNFAGASRTRRPNTHPRRTRRSRTIHEDQASLWRLLV